MRRSHSCTEPSSQETRLLRADHVDHQTRAIRLGARPHPVPLDPAIWAVLHRYLGRTRLWCSDGDYGCEVAG